MSTRSSSTAAGMGGVMRRHPRIRTRADDAESDDEPQDVEHPLDPFLPITYLQYESVCLLTSISLAND